MKRFLIVAAFCLAAVSAKAQFTQGTNYVGAALSEFGMSYNKKAKISLGLSAEAGYFFADSWQVRGYAGYTYRQDAQNDIELGLGVRYHILQNGIFLGAGAAYQHQKPNYNDLLVPIEIGYTFYLNNHVAIEPSLYYKMSVNDFDDGSTVGLKIGFGLYF